MPGEQQGEQVVNFCGMGGAAPDSGPLRGPWEQLMPAEVWGQEAQLTGEMPLQHPHLTPRLGAAWELRRNQLLEKSLPAAQPNLCCQSPSLPALVFSTIDLLDCRNIKNLKLLVLIITSWRLHHSMCLAMLGRRLGPSLAPSSY